MCSNFLALGVALSRCKLTSQPPHVAEVAITATYYLLLPTT